MKYFFRFLIGLTVASAVANAQAPSAPAKVVTPSKTATPAMGASSSSTALKIPPGIPRGRGVIKTAFMLRYQDLRPGAGAIAEPNKIYKVLYTGWLAADGHKFDSSEDHRQPLVDKDGKPVLGDDGKPQLGDPQPISFLQGFGRVIPGFDQGFEGMKVGGKRRLFIPWQLAYGARGRPGPDPAHPGIPPKSDLIFDIELVDIADMQMPPRSAPNPVHPGMTLPPGHAPVTPPPAGATPAPPAGQSGAPAPQPGSRQSDAPPGSAPAASAPQPDTKPASPPSGGQPSTSPPQ